MLCWSSSACHVSVIASSGNDLKKKILRGEGGSVVCPRFVCSSTQDNGSRTRDACDKLIPRTMKIWLFCYFVKPYLSCSRRRTKRLPLCSMLPIYRRHDLTVTASTFPTDKGTKKWKKYLKTERQRKKVTDKSMLGKLFAGWIAIYGHGQSHLLYYSGALRTQCRVIARTETTRIVARAECLVFFTNVYTV